MANKVIIGILVLLVILMGGIGYYSYTLSQQLDNLGERLTIFSERLTTFEMEQAARIDAVNDELFTLRSETLSSISTLEGKIGETLTEIDTLEKEIGTTQNWIARLEEEIDGVTSQVDILEERLTGAVNELSRSVMDASEVYEGVSQATVTINDGQNTVGSGLILDTEAHVVTAHHVIEGLSQIYIILHDGRISKATDIGHCQVSDIAVLKLEENPAIEPPPLADSSLVRIGEPVVALGSPLDLRDTLTAGIVSQINRFAAIQYNKQSRSVPNLIQFDAPVNPGNSGCPLANAAGEVIGIVIARVNPNEGDGIYYAVAANKVKRVTAALIAQGSFDYPWIGVEIASLTPQIVEDRALETISGILVAGVFNDSPAEAAGIEVDDIIISIDDMPVGDSADLTSYLGEFKSPGDVAKIEVIRGTNELELFIEIGNRP
jgi:S1-C subfamily serine protease